MTDLVPSSRVRELQAMLFPVQPIPGVTLTNLQISPDLQVNHLGRCEASKKDESTLFLESLNATKHRETRETLRALLDARCAVNDIVQEIARWPTECEVIPERIRHIEYNPTEPEPFYAPSGKEPKPKPICDELGEVLFNYCPTNVTNYFSRSCVGGSVVLPFPVEYSTVSKPRSPSPNGNTNEDEIDGPVTETPRLAVPDYNDVGDLHFESRFESGNLGKVVKITDTYYQLYLRRDMYTQRHTQWYYFRISNTRSRITYRLSIVNLCKDESLYNDGLKPLLYSTEDARTRAIGWRRCGDNITYYRNNDSSEEDREKHTLTFNVSFPYDQDTVYLAHCYPYTYTDLQEYLAKIVTHPVKTRFTKLRLLCRTLAGNGVYYLTITAPTYDDEVRRKRGVVITARVHPGETPSSWTMKGIIDFLTGESNQARELRERFVFKLVPMLNPDGVIVGNNRCSLSGKDLNRQYRTVMRESYPSVWHTKLMIRRLLEECGIAIYCDLHAHSRKHNIFAYGCESKRTGCYMRLSEQVFPLMLHKNAADKFSFENCKFHVEKGKEGTGRVVMWSMGVQNSYTMEASMGGSTLGSRSGTHFSAQDYEHIGKAFCETLLDFYDQDPAKERLRNKIVARLIKEGSSAEEPTNIELTDYSSDEGDTSSESEEVKEEFTSDTWICKVKDEIWEPFQYPCVPPPSPTSVPSARRRSSKWRVKKGASGKNYLERRKLSSRRAVMDLPTTEPGSDLYELTDSADESFVWTGEASGRLHKRREEVICPKNRETEDEKEEYSGDCLILPAIVRPRSVSFGENLIEQKQLGRTREKSHCLRLSRVLRNSSPMAKGQDVQMKLTSLRQQIWMGLPVDIEQIDGNIMNTAFASRSPLSWGVSSMALSSCHFDSEILLRSCSKKLESIDRGNETRRQRRKCSRKRSTTTSAYILPTLESVDKQEDDINDDEEHQQKAARSKKKSRFKWQKAVNLNSRIKDTRGAKPSFLSVKADSVKLIAMKAEPLKLVSIAIPPKSQTRSQTRSQTGSHPKQEGRRKFRKGDIVATTLASVSRESGAKLQATSRFPLQSHARLRARSCETSTSDDCSLSESNARKTAKKKQRKKKGKDMQRKPKNNVSPATKKKRAASAKTLRNVA